MAGGENALGHHAEAKLTTRSNKRKSVLRKDAIVTHFKHEIQATNRSICEHLHMSKLGHRQGLPAPNLIAQRA